MLHEDIEWAAEIISENKLNPVNFGPIKQDMGREEICAWMDKINLK